MSDVSLGKVDALVVEDDDDLRETVSALLREHGLTIETARNGQEAMEALTRFAPKVLVLDMLMPVMNGFELIAWLDGTPAYASIPRVITTWLRHTPLASERVLAKPLQLESLLLAVREFAQPRLA